MDQQMNYGSSPEQAMEPVMLKRKIKHSYNTAGIAMILQLLIVLGVSLIAGVVVSSGITARIMQENPGISQAELMQKAQEAGAANAQDPFFANVVNTIGYLFGNIGTFLIMVGALKAFKAKEVFSAPRKAPFAVGGVIGILALQGLSIVIQGVIESVTQMTGVSENMQTMTTFNGDPKLTALIFFYFVIVAPVTEELLCRGFVLNALAPIDRRFALYASSILFGLMHGNFNQIFNGFLIGLLLGYLTLKTGSIFFSIAAHMLANLNAMGMQYLFSYKTDNTTAMLIYAAIVSVIGLVCLVIFIKKNGKVNTDTDTVTSYMIDVPDKKGLTWKAFFTSPAVIIVAVVYIILAIVSVNSIAG